MRWIGALSLAALVATAVVPGCGGGGTGGGSGFPGDEDASAGGGDDATVSALDAHTPPVTGSDASLGNGDAAKSSCPNPKTCKDLNATCGPAGDGCGGVLDCGTCAAPNTCGGGGVPSQCGDSTPCKPKTCAQIGASCGPQGDGCGGMIDCGTCTSPETCGGGGKPNVCGASSAADAGPPPNCHPRTCAQANATCGQVADGCGGLTASCGNCIPPAICGGGGVPNQCGDSNLDGGPGACTNLCPQIPQCDAGTTSISGTVVAPTLPSFQGPSGPDPLYGALVYIPNSPNGQLDPFPDGVSCDQCGAQASGQPLVSAVTGPDGKFKLTGVPAGNNIPIVYQLGRWRREVFVNVSPCVDNPLTLDQTRMPRKQHEGTAYDNIPLTAIVTGSVDALECVLEKIGVDPTQFGNPTNPAFKSGAPRIQIYEGSPSAGAVASGGAAYDGNTPKEDTLWSSAATLKQYDQVLLACQGGPDTRTTAALAAMKSYADAGGRVYSTHYSYDWLAGSNPWNTTADWSNPDTGNDPPDPVTATVDQSFTKGQAFAQWLSIVKAASAPGKVPIAVSRHDFFTPIQNGGQQWLYATTPDADTPLHYTFNTPVSAPAAQQCGRVLYSDFHVTNVSTSSSTHFPSECSSGAMTAQEKVLEFMIFDLASCIQAAPPPPPPTCTPQTCGQLGVQCGPAGDGCGNVIQCGQCGPGQACGAGGASQCGPIGNPCTPETCTQLGVQCGPAGDGCGNLIQCGDCTPPATCGGGGTPGKCGMPSCTPVTCADQHANCGTVANGCGGTLDCGSCTPPQTCGGGGTPNQCGGGTR